MKRLILILALLLPFICQAAPKLLWSDDGATGYWGGLQGTIGTSNATDLTEGTLPNARLSSDVLLNNATGVNLSGYITTAVTASNLADSINILAYGADPTGASDSTGALTNAVKAAAGSKWVYVPPGTYIISNALFDARATAAYTNVYIRGASKLASTFYSSVETQRFGHYGSMILAFIGTSNVVVESLGFLGVPLRPVGDARTNAQTCALWFGDVSANQTTNWNVLVRDVRARDLTGFGVTCGGLTFLDNVKILDSEFTSCGNTNLGDGAGIAIGGNNVIISRNTVRRGGHYGIELWMQGGVENSNRNYLVSENIVEDTTGNAEIGTTGAGDSVAGSISIIGNMISTTARGVGSAGLGQAINANGQSLIIANNSIYSPTNAHYYGIYIGTQATNAIVTGNMIYAPAGIYGVYSPYTLASQNMFLNNSITIANPAQAYSLGGVDYTTTALPLTLVPATFTNTTVVTTNLTVAMTNSLGTVTILSNTAAGTLWPTNVAYAGAVFALPANTVTDVMFYVVSGLPVHANTNLNLTYGKRAGSSVSHDFYGGTNTTGLGTQLLGNFFQGSNSLATFGGPTNFWGLTGRSGGTLTNKPPFITTNGFCRCTTNDLWVHVTNEWASATPIGTNITVSFVVSNIPPPVFNFVGTVTASNLVMSGAQVLTNGATGVTLTFTNVPVLQLEDPKVGVLVTNATGIDQLGAGAVGSETNDWNAAAAASASSSQNWNTAWIRLGTGTQSWDLASVVSGANSNSWTAAGIASSTSSDNWNTAVSRLAGGTDDWNTAWSRIGIGTQSWNAASVASASSSGTWNSVSVSVGASSNAWNSIGSSGTWNSVAVSVGASSNNWNAGSFTNGASVGGVSITSNMAASVAFTPGNWMTNSLIGQITNVQSRSVIYVDFVIHGSNSLLGFVISNSWNVTAANFITNSVFSASTNRVTGTMKFEADPNEIITISNIVTATGSSYWYNARGRTR